MASTALPPGPNLMIAEPANDSKSNEKRSSSDEKFSSGAATPQDLEKQSADSEASSPDGGKPSDAPNYPPTKEVILIMLSLYLVMFLMALDRTIIATAIPYITDDFNSFGDAGWYGSAYMLTTSAFMLILGRVYTFYNPKWVFFAVICVFELGSVICGAAPSSTSFIVGRAIAGLGAAGIVNGAICIMLSIIPLAKRPIYQGLFGSVFGIASVVGPLLGGVFTERVSWRWCFYINLPIGAVTLAVVAFVVKIPGPKNEKTLKEQFAQLDPIGNLFFLPGIVCLLLALQWGGSTYAWNNGRIIALLVIFGLCICAFIAVQIWKGDKATVPPHIIKQRSIAAGFWFSTCNGGAMMVMVYYLPIWFQVIKDASPVHSGIMNLPVLFALFLGTVFSGIFVKKVGYYVPPMLASSIMAPIGLGLLTTFTPYTGHAKWIGYQALFGLGLGVGMQQPNMAAQTVLARKDVPTGVSLSFFAQQLGGSLFVSIGQNVLVNKLVSGLSDVPNFNPAVVVNTGATEIKNVVGAQNLPMVKAAYNHAIMGVFDVALALSCMTILASLAMEWRNIKSQKDR